MGKKPIKILIPIIKLIGLIVTAIAAIPKKKKKKDKDNDETTN